MAFRLHFPLSSIATCIALTGCLSPKIHIDESLGASPTQTSATNSDNGGTGATGSSDSPEEASAPTESGGGENGGGENLEALGGSLGIGGSEGSGDGSNAGGADQAKASAGSGGLAYDGTGGSSCSDRSPQVGCLCTGLFACVGNLPRQKQQLICKDGKWNEAPPCPGHQYCTPNTGSCAEADLRCENLTQGFTTCANEDTIRICEDDWTSSRTESCKGRCVQELGGAHCDPPRCGDGKRQDAEECDDGNATPLDGCEPYLCKRSKVLDLALGQSHTCALAEGGYVRCWGNNASNQLGLGHRLPQANRLPCALTAEDLLTPAGPIDLGGEATAIAVGNSHTCALLKDQTVRCWGENSRGQLGYGTTNPSLASPREKGAVNLGIGARAIAIAAGEFVSCALLNDGTVRCWGANDLGQIGLGTSAAATVATPSLVPVGGPVNQIAVSGIAVCALLRSGGVRCWGSNEKGLLGMGTAVPGIIGDGEPASASDLVEIPSARSVSDLTLGAKHACIRLDNGQVECWGVNNTGQLGLGNTAAIGDNESPITGVNLLTGVSAIAAGGSHTCAITSAGLRCWGQNDKGQLGYRDRAVRGNTADTIPSTFAPISWSGGQTVRKVYPGPSHTCVRLNDDSVRCWGWNATGQLGLGYASPNDGGTTDWVGGSPSQLPDSLAPVPVFQCP